jgi:ectoine hydroxylase-related dioxygenase (phytanoyl-CoA dioxygenase family)
MISGVRFVKRNTEPLTKENITNNILFSTFGQTQKTLQNMCLTDNIVDNFSNDGYVIIKNVFDTTPTVSASESNIKCNDIDDLIELMRYESKSLYYENQAKFGSIKVMDDTITSSCVIEPMSDQNFNDTGSGHVGQYFVGATIDHEIKIDKTKYQQARLNILSKATTRKKIMSSKNNTKITKFSAHKKQRIIDHILFNKSLESILKKILGNDLYLLNEQYILKPPCGNKTMRNGSDKTTAFQWHRDYDSLKDKCRNTLYPYVSVWIALNDMTLKNGCLFILPKHLEGNFNRVGGKLNIYDVTLEHLSKFNYPNTYKYFKPILLKKGDICILSNDVWHCSVPNTTDDFRIAYMPQYSSGPIYYDEDIDPGVVVSMATNRIRKRKIQHTKDSFPSIKKAKQLVAFAVKL